VHDKKFGVIHTYLVIGMGNPRGRPVPVPAQTHTHEYGYGFPWVWVKGIDGSVGSMGTAGCILPPVKFTHVNLSDCIRTPHQLADRWAAAVGGSKGDEMTGRGEGWMENGVGWLRTKEEATNEQPRVCDVAKLQVPSSRC
jgi:hypothetical protein